MEVKTIKLTMDEIGLIFRALSAYHENENKSLNESIEFIEANCNHPDKVDQLYVEAFEFDAHEVALALSLKMRFMVFLNQMEEAAE